MRKIVFAFALLIGISAYAQEEISGVTPAKSIVIEGSNLSFNGAGLREKYFLDLYVGALYLTNKTSDANKVINANEKMAITIDIVSGLITSEKMITAIDEGFEKSTKGKTDQFKKEIQEFKDAFKEEIVKGDHYVISYTSESGITVTKNGKIVKQIKGFEFKKALFGIWLCDEPADEDLKEGMLGLD